MRSDQSPEAQESSAYQIVVPIADPEAADGLLRIAASIARQHLSSEVLVVSVVEVPMVTPLSQAKERDEDMKERQNETLRRVEDVASRLGISLRTVPLWTHDVSEAVLELVENEGAAHLLLHWDEKHAQNSSFSASDLKTMARETKAEVILLRRAAKPRFERVAALVSQSPHATRAVQRAWDFARSTDASRLTLIHARQPSDAERDIAITDDTRATGEQLIARVASEIGLPPERFESQVVIDPNPASALLKVLRSFDTVCVGASARTKMVERLFGSIPESVSTRFPGTVAIVQRPKSDQRTVIDVLLDRLMAR